MKLRLSYSQIYRPSIPASRIEYLAAYSHILIALDAMSRVPPLLRNRRCSERNQSGIRSKQMERRASRQMAPLPSNQTAYNNISRDGTSYLNFSVGRHLNIYVAMLHSIIQWRTALVVPARRSGVLSVHTMFACKTSCFWIASLLFNRIHSVNLI